MKLTTVLGALVCILLWSPSSFARSCTVLQLTDNDYQDVMPLISDSGQVLWQSSTPDEGHLTDLSYWDGSGIVRLFSGLKWEDEDAPVMNAGGKAAWDGRTSGARLGEGYLWDGVSVVRLTENELRDRDVMINDAGSVVWSGFDGSDYEIFLRNGSEIRQLTDNGFNDFKPQINAAGQVAWIGYDGSDDEIFFWDGTAVRQLTRNSSPDFMVRINAAGQVAWQGFDGRDTEVYFWNGSTVVQVTDNAFHDSFAADEESPESLQLSDRGQILWLADRTGGTALYLRDGETVTLLSEETFGYMPAMNAEGQATWVGTGPSGKGVYYWNGSAAVLLGKGGASPGINEAGQVVWHAHDGTDFEVFLWDGSSVIQLTDNDYHDFYARINAAGEIVWQGAVKPSNREIFLARPSLDQGSDSERGVADHPNGNGQWDVLIASDRSLP